MNDGFQRVLDHIRSTAETEFAKGKLFERLMKTYFREDPLYSDRFSKVWLWSEWAATRPDFDANDIGIDLVAGGARWRLLRHSVQVLRTRYAPVQTATRFVPCGLSARAIHRTYRRRYRR